MDDSKFKAAIDSQHRLAVRTAEALRKVVLIDTKRSKKTELDDFPTGQIDPQMQLLLIARDEYLGAEDPGARLGFYKSMRDVYQALDARTMKVLEVVMKERHHRDKLELLARSANANEPTEAEVLAAISGDDSPAEPETGTDAP